MPSPVHIRLSREIPAQRDAAYAWLTDFQDSDVDRADAVIEMRKVIERSPTRIVYEGEQVVLGRRSTGTSEVTLHPPDRWEAKVIAGPRTGSFTHYRLVPVGSGASRLTVDYNLIINDPQRHFLLRLAKPLVKRELSKMWDGFEAAMRKELHR
ncbi:MAG TPA: SRPBCC family protein [Candidatus Thermoplasmatota archaeon]|nr:SRPBCC family protein [Candidatus Thermoplasmatota archaeon]